MTETASNLPRLLGEAKRWFDDALFTGMEAAGERPVTVAQAAVFSVLPAEGCTISEIARRIGVRRQTVHQAVHGLIGMGLLEQIPDPASARNRLVRTTAEGARVHRRAQATLTVIEDVLAQRIGAASTGELRRLLSLPWGEPPRVQVPPGDT
ncbi:MULTISPECIES: MarR family winged helix-turn-helix transcriptional regulator [Actinomadura]|uniref:MarR family winged helix-turn-helix transcriptional regulator n=1 Tax=Actinomadura yumaensis TaxID=111807 RepID=A0ABW2CC57_9ACTN|nr:MarR family winged helix-turn-helix transcriptional regulator [Actinomadura sp. J1-007]MWK38381.1 MarR family transcriptional regulator [Actinomadura sp. J1-007]